MKKINDPDVQALTKRLEMQMGAQMQPPEFALEASRQDAPNNSKKPKPTTKYSSATHKPVTGGTLYSKGAGDSNEVALNDVTQGDLGDCYFLAAVGALAKSNPAAIKKLIKDNGDGTYNVTLFDYNNVFSSTRSPQVVKVKPTFVTTAGGVNPYAKTGDNKEFWVMLIEKAFAQYEGSYSEIEGSNYSGNALELLTGKTQTRVQISSVSEDKLLTNLKALVDGGHAVTVGSKQSKDGSKKTIAAGKLGILMGHDYVLRDVDVNNRTINLYNPWGSKHLPAIKVADVKTYFWRYDSVK